MVAVDPARSPPRPGPAAERPPASTDLAGQCSELYGPLLRIACRRTHNRADAEDLVQLAFLRALERTSSQRDTHNWSAWLNTVVQRLAIDRARRSRRRQCVEIDSVSSWYAQPECAPPAWQDVSPEHLRAAIRRCDDQVLVVYELRYGRNLSYAQIAERLGVPLGTVATRLRRARLELAKVVRRSAPAGSERAARRPPAAPRSAVRARRSAPPADPRRLGRSIAELGAVAVSCQKR